MANFVPPNVANITNKQKRKTRRPVIFCRPGVDQLNNAQLNQQLENAMSSLSLNNHVYDRFEDMDLHPDILKGIFSYGLEKPAYIQERAIVPCIKGKDAIVQAQSGMGKTAALVISVLQRLDRSNPSCQALVLAPTRELAEQIQGVFNALSQFMSPKVTSYTCVGGRSDMKQCKRACLTGRQVIIGTLGRICHMLVGDGNGVYLSTDFIKTLALDEADQLLDGNYGRDLTIVLEKIPKTSQVILMSATMPGNILKLAWRFMVNPLTFLVKDFQLTLDGIRQYYVDVRDDADKILTLADLFPIILKSRGMIFCNLRSTVVKVMRKMNDAGHILSCITGDMSQSQRDEIMAKFRLGEPDYRVIITSDLLGRGIDVQQLNLVVNYDLPSHKETYIHRVGRAGRYGRKGVSLSFVGVKEQSEFEQLKAFYSTQIDPMPVKGTLIQLLTS